MGHDVIFRRITQHLKDLNWFAAVLDLLIVVVGIFIGLQVDAWNEFRQERVIEGKYLERLLVDMNLSIEAQLELFELEKAGIDSMDKLARDLEDGTLSEQDRDSTVRALNYIGWVENPKTRLVTLNELQSSGNISQIQNSEIRDALGQLQRSLEDAIYSAQQTSMLFSSNYDLFFQSAFLEPSDGEDWGYFSQPDYDYMLSIPGFAKVISSYSGWFKFHRTLLQAHHLDTVDLRDKVQAELETRFR
jgi:hypothetical protein